MRISINVGLPNFVVQAALESISGCGLFVCLYQVSIRVWVKVLVAGHSFVICTYSTVRVRSGLDLRSSLIES